MASANKLPASLKTFIVSQLAAYERPSAVVAAVKQVFDVEVSRQLVENYDPTKANGRNLGKSLREQFDRERAAYLADSEAIGIAHRPFRMRQLERLYFEAVDRRNPVLALQILELAAKEQERVAAGTRGQATSSSAPTNETNEYRDMSPIAVCRRIALIFQDAEREKQRLAAEAAAKVIEHDEPSRPR